MTEEAFTYLRAGDVVRCSNWHAPTPVAKRQGNARLTPGAEYTVVRAETYTFEPNGWWMGDLLEVINDAGKLVSYSLKRFDWEIPPGRQPRDQVLCITHRDRNKGTPASERHRPLAEVRPEVERRKRESDEHMRQWREQEREINRRAALALSERYAPPVESQRPYEHPAEPGQRRIRA